MGNVSHAVPSIHPAVKAAPEEVAIHTPAFADHARSADGDAAVIDGAKMLAMTAVDCWLDGTTLHAARAEFDARRAAATCATTPPAATENPLP